MEELEGVSIRLSTSLVKRIDFLRLQSSTFSISRTAIIRTLLEEALKNRGITDHVISESKSSRESCK